METNERDGIVNPEEELRKLREKTGQEELAELKHGLLGGYKRRDVAQYVALLKSQLQTAERTFKNRIAELTAEKDQLRYERDALQSRQDQRDTEASMLLHSELAEARLAAEGLLAERSSLEEKLLAASHAANESAELQQCAEALESELVQIREQASALLTQRDALLEEKTALAGQIGQLQADLETLGGESKAGEAALRGKLDELTGKMQANQARADKSEAELGQARGRIEALVAENKDLLARLEDARRDAEEMQAGKEAVEAANIQLRDTLNSLVVRAEALVRENEAMNGLLATERDRVLQHQAINNKLADLLSRVRTANQLLEERVSDMDKAFLNFNYPTIKPAASQAKPGKPGAAQSPAPKSDPLKDILTELNAIQVNLAQYQAPAKPAAEPEKKPNIRYSVEKLEVECKPEKPETLWDDTEGFPRPGIKDFTVKPR